MFKQITRMLLPYKRVLSWVLIGIGALLLLIFVPVEIWMAIAGIVLLVIGIILVRS